YPPRAVASLVNRVLAGLAPAGVAAMTAELNRAVAAATMASLRRGAIAPPSPKDAKLTPRFPHRHMGKHRNVAPWLAGQRCLAVQILSVVDLAAAASLTASSRSSSVAGPSISVRIRRRRTATRIDHFRAGHPSPEGTSCRGVTASSRPRALDP